MRINFLGFFILLVTFTSISTKAQEVMKANVVTIVPFGADNEFSILQEVETGDYYKTSPFPTGELIYNTTVGIKSVRNDEGSVQVLSDDLTIVLMAREIGTDNLVIHLPTSIQMPDLENDILYFQDTSHLNSFYGLVETYLENTKESVGLDEKLSYLEHVFSGFISHRQYFSDDHAPASEGYTDLEIEELLADDFIADDVLKSFFNEYRLIGVGERIYYYHERGTIVSIDKYDNESRKVLEFISREEDMHGYDVFDLNSPLLWNEAFIFEEGKSKIGKGKGVLVVDNVYTYQVRPVIHTNLIECNPFYGGFRLSLSQIQQGGQSGPTSTPIPLGNAANVLTVDWGDGTIETFQAYNEDDLYHTYSSIGTFSVQASLTFVDAYGDPQTILEGSNAPVGMPILFNTAISCVDRDDADYGWAQSGNWKLAAKVWANDNLFGDHVGSYSEAFKKVNGSWRRRRAELYTSIDATFRWFDCTVQGDKSGSKRRNYRKKIRKTKSKGSLNYNYNYAAGDIFSNHQLVKNGTTINLVVVLDPCD